MTGRAFLWMAGFVVLTACAGLLLSHRLMGIYRHSLAVNQRWSERLTLCGELAERADAISTPADDLFNAKEARAAAEAGAQVTLVAGPVHLSTPRGVRRIDVRTAQQMHDAVLPLAPHHDVFVATAAVADWRPAAPAGEKIKKDGSGQVPAIGAERQGPCVGHGGRRGRA